MDGVKVLASGFEMDEKVLQLHDTSLPTNSDFCIIDVQGGGAAGVS